MSSSKRASAVAPKYLRTNQWIEITGMGKPLTYKHLYAGSLKAVRVNKAWFIHATEVTDFFEREGESTLACRAA